MMLLEEIENKEDKQPQYKIFCDLDGVLADFVKGVKEVLKLNHDEDKYEIDPAYRKIMWKAVGEYSQSGGKLWGELDMMPDAMLLWNYISKYPDTEILTATGDPKYGAAEQKRGWVAKYLGNNKTNIVRMAKLKAQYAAPDHVLIDDKEKALNPWIESGGIGILHTSATDTINKLKKLGL